MPAFLIYSLYISVIALSWSLCSITTNSFAINFADWKRLNRRELMKELKSSLVISTVIGRFFDLTPINDNSYRCLCPFHDDHNPSMVVYDSSNSFYCFACGTSGDAFKFLSHMKNTTYSDVLNKACEAVYKEEDLLSWLGEGHDCKPMQGYKPEKATLSRPLFKKTPSSTISHQSQLSKEHSYDHTDDQLKLQILALSQLYFSARLLMDPEVASVRKYLKDRKISPKTAAAFHLGYAPWTVSDGAGRKRPVKSIAGISTADWKALHPLALNDWLETHTALRQNHSVDKIGQAVRDIGLVKVFNDTYAANPNRSSKPTGCNKVYDRFRGRLIIPILNRHAQVVGLAGRVLPAINPNHNSPSNTNSTRVKVSKYINSPASSVFHKRNVLFGEHLAREHCQACNATIVVEGYFDVITLHELGFKHVVAAMGTSISIEQLVAAAQLSSAGGEVVLLFDGDAAGRSAVSRAQTLLKRYSEGKFGVIHNTTVSNDREWVLKCASMESAQYFIRQKLAKHVSNHTTSFLLPNATQHFKDCGEVFEVFGRKETQSIISFMLHNATTLQTFSFPNSL